MTVKDLIKKLEALDQNAEVIVTSSNFELNAKVFFNKDIMTL